MDVPTNVSKLDKICLTSQCGPRRDMNWRTPFSSMEPLSLSSSPSKSLIFKESLPSPHENFDTFGVGEKMQRPLLMIPGPVEMDEEVLKAAGSIGTSHVDPAFVKTFGSALRNVKVRRMTRVLCQTLTFPLSGCFSRSRRNAVCCCWLRFARLGHVWGQRHRGWR